MTPEKQRIAIAEACGHVMDKPDEFPTVAIRQNGSRYVIPDFLNDLNAMHEAEKVFDEDGGEHWEKWHDWVGWLMSVCTIDAGRDWKTEPFLTAQAGWKVIARATAPQRAEAFLRTLGKWEEQP